MGGVAGRKCGYSRRRALKNDLFLPIRKTSMDSDPIRFRVLLVMLAPFVPLLILATMGTLYRWIRSLADGHRLWVHSRHPDLAARSSAR